MVKLNLVALLGCLIVDTIALPTSNLISDAAYVIPPPAFTTNFCESYISQCQADVAILPSATLQSVLCTSTASTTTGLGTTQVMVECWPFNSTSDTTNYHQSNYNWSWLVAQSLGATLAP